MLRSRIAPTPSGYLHIGNAVNFVLTWLWVRRENGVLRLRIDDLDTTRTRPEYLEDIFQTLEWLGLDWDEGPQTPDEHNRLYSQNLRTDRYNELIAKLIQTGKVFACTCSRKDVTGQYPGICRNKCLALDTWDAALRVVTPENSIVSIWDVERGEIPLNLYEAMRDFVIRRRDGIAAYQMASLVDDTDFNINLIVRGEDLLYSTAAQLYLAGLNRNRSFSQTTFYHHPLLKDEQGAKLSKSAGSASIKTWREGGKNQEDFCRLLSRFLGWKDEARSFGEMLLWVKDGLPLIKTD